MTDAAAAIRAEFTSYKHVPTRKVFQMIFEVPEEHASDVMTKLGWPIGGQTHDVAIARIQPAEGEQAP